MPEEPPYSITLHMPSPVVQIDAAIGRSEATDVPRDLRFQRLNRFPGGNGRVRHLSQTPILSPWKRLCARLPFESVSHAQRRGHHRAIWQTSAASESTPFVAFMLGVVLDALRLLSVTAA